MKFHAIYLVTYMISHDIHSLLILLVRTGAWAKLQILFSLDGGSVHVNEISETLMTRKLVSLY